MYYDVDFCSLLLQAYMCCADLFFSSCCFCNRLRISYKTVGLTIFAKEKFRTVRDYVL